MILVFWVFLHSCSWSRSKFECLKPKAGVLLGFRQVLKRPWASKSIDFARDILQKSTFSAMYVQDLFQSLLESHLDRHEPSKWNPRGAPRGSENPGFYVFAVFARRKQLHGSPRCSKRPGERILFHFSSIFGQIVGQSILGFKCNSDVSE